MQNYASLFLPRLGHTSLVCKDSGNWARILLGCGITYYWLWQKEEWCLITQSSGKYSSATPNFSLRVMWAYFYIIDCPTRCEVSSWWQGRTITCSLTTFASSWGQWRSPVAAHCPAGQEPYTVAILRTVTVLSFIFFPPSSPSFCVLLQSLSETSTGSSVGCLP